MVAHLAGLRVIRLAMMIFPVLIITGGQPAAAAINIHPVHVGVGLFYSGTVIRVEGELPPGYEAALVFQGRDETLELKKKGKVGGILWMNVGDLVFENVPSVYMLSTSCKLADLCQQPDLEKCGVGYPALEARAVLLPAGEKKSTFFPELIKLKEADKLFSFREGGIHLEPDKDGARHLTGECFVPARMPPGEYEARLYGFRGGHGQMLQSRRFDLQMVGATKFISFLAINHGLIYGVLAVFIALVIGLLTGMVFGLGSRRGH